MIDYLVESVLHHHHVYLLDVVFAFQFSWFNCLSASQCAGLLFPLKVRVT